VDHRLSRNFSSYGIRQQFEVLIVNEIPAAKI
jgi:hypothetical protein